MPKDVAYGITDADSYAAAPEVQTQNVGDVGPQAIAGDFGVVFDDVHEIHKPASCFAFRPWLP
jgi:hypothetical protein